MSDMLKVSAGPHVRSSITTNKMMFAVVVALMPTTILGIMHFGMHAAILILISIATAIISELVFELLFKKPITTGDFSAVVTGLLLGLNLPPRAPWWIAVVGSIFAIIVVKMLFGGLGQNFMNPALAGRAFLFISFAGIMTDYSTDTFSGATPLALIKAGETVDVYSIIMGKMSGGVIGENSMLAIVIGACLLILLGIIDLKVPGSYIVAFVISIALLSKRGFDPAYISAQLSCGGLMIGAFFMATDYVTRPITKVGQLVYGVVLGVLTALFRVVGSGVEGVSFAIIIGNLLVPLIEKYTRPKAFGRGGERS